MRLSFLLLAALLLGAGTARADYIYTLTITDIGPYAADYNGTYTFDESSILTSPTTITAAELTSSSGPTVVSVYLNPTDGQCSPENYGASNSCFAVNYFSFVIDGLVETYSLYGFFDGYVDSVGTFSTATIDSLSIEPEVASTPEPSSIALLGTGLLGFAGVVRRKVLR